MLAYDMFEEALNGDGSDKEYDEKSKLSKALKKSTAIKAEFEKNLNDFTNYDTLLYGLYYGTISTYEGNTATDKDLSLSVGAARYSMVIYKETRTTGFLFWEKEQVRYVAEVTVTDTYDFTEWRTDGSFGSRMNNIAYFGQHFGIIKPYDWKSTFVISTEWEDV